MRVALLDPTGPQDLQFLKEFASGLELVAPETQEESLRDLVSGSHVILSKRRLVSADLMDAAGGGLRLIQLWSNRRDHVNLGAARDRGVKVALMPQVGCIAVAELALLLILGLSKKIVRAHAATVAGAYQELGVEPIVTAERRHKFQWMALPDLFELNGTSLGLIGFGEIATEVARRARPFGMNVFYFKRDRLPADIEAEEGVEFLEFAELLETSDFVSLHVPHTQETEKLIDASALERMKSSAYLVNTCRGGVVDEEALVDALRNGNISGAGLDVFVREPIPHDHPLLRLENVLLTPHIGGGSGGARVKHVRDIMTNIQRLSRGEQPEHVIGLGQ